MKERDRQREEENIRILKTILVGWSFDLSSYLNSIELISPEGIHISLDRRTYRRLEGRHEFELPKSTRSVQDFGHFLHSKEFRLSIAWEALCSNFFYTTSDTMDRWETDPILREALEKYSPISHSLITNLSRDLLLRRPLSEEEREKLYLFFLSGSLSKDHAIKWISALLLHNSQVRSV